MGKILVCVGDLSDGAHRPEVWVRSSLVWNSSHRSLGFGALSHRKFEVWSCQRILVLRLILQGQTCRPGRVSNDVFAAKILWHFCGENRPGLHAGRSMNAHAIQIHDELLRGNLDGLRRWISSGECDVNAGFICERTLLHFACEPFELDPGNRFSFEWEHNFVPVRNDVIRLLLAHGADVNQRDEMGHTSFHFCNDQEGAALLLNNGAEIDARSHDGMTSLMWAAQHGHLDVVRFLLRRGANLELVDNDGHDAVHYAREYLPRPPSGWQSGAKKLQLLSDVKNAGGWKPYVAAPRVALVRLRLLCARGRATPLADPALARLFGAPDESIRRAVPMEVFWHVLAYWRSSRDDE